MKIWFKRILLGLLVALIAALAAFAVFLLTFNPNSYKSKLEDLVYSKYHRTLTVGGDIQLSLFPRIGLSLQDISLSDRDSKNIFASIDSARFAVAIWPLLSNRFVVDHVSVSGLKAWVARDKEGAYNFEDLTAGASSPAVDTGAPADSGSQPGSVVAVTSPVGRADLQIDIAGLDIKDGEIHLRDERKGHSARLVKLQVNTGRMTLDQPFDVAIRGNLIGEHPASDAAIEGQALFKFDSVQRSYSAQKLNLQVTGRLGDLQAKTATLKGNLAYNAMTRLLNAGNLELNVQGDLGGEQPIKGLELSLVVPKLRMDRSRSELNIEKLSLRSKGNFPTQAFDIALDAPQLSISPEAAKGEAVSGSIKLSGSSVIGLSLGASGLGGNADNLTLKELKVDGGIKQDNRMVRVNLSSPAQWDALKGQGTLSAIKGDVKIEHAVAPPRTFEFPLIGSLHLDLLKDTLNSEISAVLNGRPLNFNVKATELNDPKVQFALQSEGLDLDKLFPPEPPAKPEAKPEAKAEAKPETKPETKPEAKPEAKPAAKPDAKAEAKPDANAAGKPAQPETEAKAGAKPPAKRDAAQSAAKPAAPAAAPSGGKAAASSGAKAGAATAANPQDKGAAASAPEKPAATAAAPAAKAPAAAPRADTTLDLSFLDSLDLTGSVKVGEIKGRGIEAKNFGVSVKAAKGKLELSKMTADLYGGKLSGKINADSSNAMAGQIALENVAVGPMLKGLTGTEHISGTGTLKLNLASKGNTVAALTAGLGGTAQALVRDGAIQGIDVERTLAQVAGVLQSLMNEQVPDLSGKFQPGSETRFTSLDANVAFERGIGQIKKLDLNSPAVRVTQGSPASVNLINSTLDLAADVRIVNASKAGKEQFADLQGVTVPVHISGPFDALSYQVQWKAISGKLARQAIQNGLLNLISKPPASGEQNAAPTKSDAVKSLGNALKGLLGK
ncbi:AsmA family protein [Eoetvoesiella caeni]|uniref:AsmA-like protein n=1 Tax=Eoetvoesiella caeni TaxID=645616 RepID=A0A366H2M2_9BURK|nr:AsmA family protein [Eoetvoesiella caeni]NYT57066.1 AsmA family protein [Eoetvoesiella caeni]RBP35025.1 AsmA-like protein [Eoetvoesiella caeni]